MPRKSGGELKPHQKSIRFSDTVNKYILSFDGEGFNEKLDTLVLHCLKDEDDRKQRIKDLDKLMIEKRKQYEKMIQDKEKEFQDCISKIKMIKKLANDTEIITGLVKELSENTDKLIELCTNKEQQER